MSGFCTYTNCLFCSLPFWSASLAKWMSTQWRVPWISSLLVVCLYAVFSGLLKTSASIVPTVPNEPKQGCPSHHEEDAYLIQLSVSHALVLSLSSLLAGSFTGDHLGLRHASKVSSLMWHCTFSVRILKAMSCPASLLHQISAWKLLPMLNLHVKCLQLPYSHVLFCLVLEKMPEILVR